MGTSYVVVLVCQACAAVAAIASLRWLAIYVTPETYGRYALYQSIVSAGALLLTSWPNAALLRYGREEWAAYRRMGETLAARIALFVVCLAIAILVAVLLDSSLQRFLGVERSPFELIALGIVVAPALELAVYMNQACGRTEMYGYAPLITRVGFFLGVLLIPVLRPHANWGYLAVCIAASTAAAGVFAVVTVPRSCYRGFQVNAERIRLLLRYSWTLPFAGVSTYIVNWIDSWVIRGVRGIDSVGVYNWAYQTTVIATLAFAPIAVVLTPRVIDARVHDDRARLQRYADAILPTVRLASVFVTAGLVLVFPVLQRIASPLYRPAYPVIVTLLSALPFQLVAYLVTPFGNAYERVLPRFVFVSVVIAIVNTAGDVLLVPKVGIVGAAIATSCSFACGSLLSVAVVRPVGIEFGPLWRYATPAFVLVPALVVLQWGGPSLGALLILPVAVCLLVIACFSGPDVGVRQRVAALGAALTLEDAGAAMTRGEAADRT